MKITIIQTDDWAGLYGTDGTCFTQGHYISESVIRAWNARYQFEREAWEESL